MTIAADVALLASVIDNNPLELRPTLLKAMNSLFDVMEAGISDESESSWEDIAKALFAKYGVAYPE